MTVRAKVTGSWDWFEQRFKHWRMGMEHASLMFVSVAMFLSQGYSLHLFLIFAH